MDKLLWQVELLPPEAGNVKKVADALNNIDRAGKKTAKSNSKVAKSTRRVSEEYEELDMQIRKYRLQATKAENATRFGNQEMDKSINIIENNRAELKRLESRIEQNIATESKRVRLKTKLESALKRTHHAENRARSGFQSLSRTMNKGNNTLIATGRILQDLPYGFIGISNNIEELAFNFSNLSNATDEATGKTLGAKGAFKALTQSFMGSGGLLFLLGSALPFALTVATNGFPGFKNMMGKTSDTAKRLDEDLEGLVNTLEKYYNVEGEDPLGIQSTKAKLSATDNLLENIQDITNAQERMAELEKSSTGMSRFAQLANQEEINALEEQVELGIERTGLNEEQIEQLQAQEGSLTNQLETLRKMGKISPLTEFEIGLTTAVNEATQAFDLGANQFQSSMLDGVENTIGTLKQQKDELGNIEDELIQKFQQGDTSVLPKLKIVQKALKDVEETLDKIPEKPVVDIQIPSDEPIEMPDLEFEKPELDDEIDFQSVLDMEEEMRFQTAISRAEGFAQDKLKIERKYQKKINQLRDKGLLQYFDMKTLEEAKQAEIERAKTKNAKTEAQKRKDTNMQLFQAVSTSANELFSALGELNSAQSDETESQARRRFETQKKLSTASAIVSSLEAFTVALSDEEIPPIAREIRAGTILASGFAKVMAIQRQEFNSSKTPSTGGSETSSYISRSGDVAEAESTLARPDRDDEQVTEAMAKRRRDSDKQPVFIVENRIDKGDFATFVRKGNREIRENQISINN